MAQQKIVDKVVDLVFSSKRLMPAHFCSYDDRTQSFGIDFEPLIKSDDYNMASESYNKVSGYIKDTDTTSTEYTLIVKLGEDTMLGAYIVTKLGHNELIGEVVAFIDEKNWETINTINNKINRLDGIKEYLRYCESFGADIANNNL